MAVEQGRSDSRSRTAGNGPLGAGAATGDIRRRAGWIAATSSVLWFATLVIEHQNRVTVKAKADVSPMLGATSGNGGQPMHSLLTSPLGVLLARVTSRRHDGHAGMGMRKLPLRSSWHVRKMSAGPAERSRIPTNVSGR